MKFHIGTCKRTRLQTKPATPFVLLATLWATSVLLGCNSSKPGMQHECGEDCIELGLQLVFPGQETHNKAISMLSIPTTINDHLPKDGQVRSTSVAELWRIMDNAKGQDWKIGVAVTLDGHLLTISDAGLHEGAKFLQVVHGQQHPRLVPLENAVEEVGKAWIVTMPSKPTFDVVVGGGRVRIGASHVDFGIVNPNAECTSNIPIDNIGQVPIVLSNPVSSCGCVTAFYQEPQSVLQPGESADLHLAMRTGAGTIKQSVLLRMFEQGTGDTSNYLMYLSASQAQSMSVTPTSIDFRGLKHGQTKKNIVRISETTMDQFEIVDIEPGPKGIEAELSTDRIQNDLTTFRLDVSADGSCFDVGNQSGTINVRTTSTLRPMLEIPYQLQILSSVTRTPNTVSFGNVALGTSSQKDVQLNFERGKSLPNVKVVGCTDGIKATLVESTKTAAKLRIRAEFNEVGPASGSVRVRTGSDNWLEEFEIPCVANVGQAN